jgi:hypothetical protein
LQGCGHRAEAEQAGLDVLDDFFGEVCSLIDSCEFDDFNGIHLTRGFVALIDQFPADFGEGLFAKTITLTRAGDRSEEAALVIANGGRAWTMNLPERARRRWKSWDDRRFSRNCEFKGNAAR